MDVKRTLDLNVLSRGYGIVHLMLSNTPSLAFHLSVSLSLSPLIAYISHGGLINNHIPASHDQTPTRSGSRHQNTVVHRPANYTC